MIKSLGITTSSDSCRTVNIHLVPPIYALSVYFGAAGVEKSRYTLPAALIADLTGFLMASLCVRLFF